jgi:hypothetical protein
MRCKGRYAGSGERMRLAERLLKMDSLGGIARLTVALIYDFRAAAENSTPAACAPWIHPSGEFFPEPQSAQTKKQIRHQNQH